MTGRNVDTDAMRYGWTDVKVEIGIKNVNKLMKAYPQRNETTLMKNESKNFENSRN